MGISRGKKIITDRLTFLVDFQNNKSYSGTVANTLNLIDGSQGTFYNGIVYSDGGLTGDGIDDYFTYNVNITPAFTYTIVAKSANSTWNTNGGLGSSRVANGFIMHSNINSTDISYYYYNSSGGVVGIPKIINILSYANSIQDNNIYTLSFDGVSSCKFYINGIVADNRFVSITRTSSTIELNILKDYNFSRYTQGNVKYLSMYNKQLTNTEVFNLHQQIRDRIPQ